MLRIRSTAAEQAGQTLLEVAMAVGVVLVLITAITIVTLEGLRNSQFSQNETQATKLAQEGIDRVRAIRDRNGLIYTGSGVGGACAGGTCVNWNSFTWNSCTTTSSCSFRLGFLDNSGGSCLVSGSSSANPCLILSTSKEPILGKFSRGITITDCLASNDTTCYNQNYPALDQKKVTSLVSWQDSGGVHQSNLVSLLRDL